MRIISTLTAPPRPTDAILEAGERVFREFGYQAATVERIAQEAGLSRVTLYRHRVSKASILAALAERATEEYREALWPAVMAAGSGRERLESALEALCQSAERNLELLVAIGSQTDRVFHDDAAEPLTRSVFTEPFERLLRDGAADGTLRTDIDPVEGATVLFNLVGWTYIHLRTGHGWPADRSARMTLDLVCNGVVAAA